MKLNSSLNKNKIILILLILSFLDYSTQVQSNQRQGGRQLQRMQAEQINKIKKDDKDIKHLKDQMNMVEAFFHPNHQPSENSFQFKQRKNQKKKVKKSRDNSTTLVSNVTLTNSSHNNSNNSNDSSNQQAQNLKYLIGPRGQSCSNIDDCEQKNQEFYKYIKKRLLGENAANGEQGPQGQKGLQGLKGQIGPQGKNGVSPSEQLLLNLTRQIAQDELFKAAQGGYVELDKLNNEFILNKIYYFGDNNCKNQRNTYVLACQADLYQDCSVNTVNPETCCPNQQCINAIDDLMCCFNKVKLTLEEIEKFDQELNAVWLPVLKDIDAYQSNQLRQFNFNGQSILQQYKDRLTKCINIGLRTDEMKCPIRGTQQYTNNFINNQNFSSSNSSNNYTPTLINNQNSSSTYTSPQTSNNYTPTLLSSNTQTSQNSSSSHNSTMAFKQNKPLPPQFQQTDQYESVQYAKKNKNRGK